MTNRLPKFLRATPFCVGLFLFCLPTTWLQAQPDFFNFSYNGPTTLFVGPTCSSMLQGNVPDPVVSSTMGFPITMSMFDSGASGFPYDFTFSNGTMAHVYWFVKDNMGHSHTYDYFINFEDNSPPTFDLTGVFDTLEFSSIAQVPVQTALPVMDNCTPIVSDTFYQTTPPDTCETGTFTRTWMATDANANTAVFTQTIIIYADTLPPQITGYPQHGSAPCEQLATAYPLWLANQIVLFNATDASGVKSLTHNGPPVFPAGCKEPLMVRFKAVDNCQFQQNVDVIFTTADTESPVLIIAPKDTVAYCSATDNELAKLREWISTKAYHQVFDSCSYPLSYTMKIGNVLKDSAQVVTAFLASFSGGCGPHVIGNQNYSKVHGFVSVDFYVQDDCGNETFMGNADFGAIDTLPPVITGTNATEQCGINNDQTALQTWINAHGNAMVTDDCSDYTWTNFSFSTSSGQVGSGNFNAGPYPSVQANNCSWSVDVTFRTTDDCGNSSTITLRWSIEDTLPPVFTGLQPNITVYCPNPLPSVPAAIVSDNCDANIMVTFARVYDDSLCAGSYTVLTTWTATDDCGNTATATQNIFVSDTTRPVFTLVPGPLTFRCDTFVLPPVPVMGLNIQAMDDCSPVMSITTTINSLQDPNPDSCDHYSYQIIRIFTATDECGNTQTATQSIFVIDNLGPVPGGILDTTALCSALTPFPAPVPIATDACSGLTAPPISTGQTIIPGSCTDTYTIAVHWIATDVCGNTSMFDQLVHVIDTVPPVLMNIPPNITVECDAIPNPPNTDSFNAQDNCLDPVTVTLLETEIRNPDTTSCEHWTDYIIKREWTATDNCGNSQTYTQLIQIEDTTPPVVVPPADMVFPNDQDSCGAFVMIPAPLSITDVCSNQFTNIIVSDFKPLIASGPGSPFTVPVADMSFQVMSPNASPFQPVVAAPATELRVILDNADAEGALEYLFVYDEGNNLIDTVDTNSQCGDKTFVFPLNINLLNKWLGDGVVNFSVKPNGTGPGACNPVCPNGKITTSLHYAYASSDAPIALTYSIDGGANLNFPPSAPIYLGTGVHTVIYTATDCVGNSSTASVQITINDTQAPSLTAPANITAFTGPNNCESTIALPFPVIAENCAMSANISLSSAVLPLQFITNPDVGLVAADAYPALTGIIPNAVGDGILRIRHKGDNALPGEFFNVYDEMGGVLGVTAQGPMAGECSTFFETEIPVTAAQINNWANIGGAPGSTFFLIESNKDFLSYSNFVSNCAPLLPNGTDGVSQIQVVLEYNYAVVNFAVKKPVNQVVATGTLTGSLTTVTLPPANYTVMYNSTDNSGLTGMTSFSITVRDTVKPKAHCDLTHLIYIDPSGAPPYVLSADSINNGSFDNCTPSGNLSYAVSPNTFTCNQAGTPVNVTLTVTDTSGNSATCNTIIGIFTLPPKPSFTPVCENYQLQLFTNPPSNAPYNFKWNGPNFNVTGEDPIVTNNAMAVHNGTYCVTITGATGCTSSACVNVELAILGNPPVLGGNGNSFCPGQNVLLNTATYNGQNVYYQWLMDASPALPIILDSSLVNNFTISGLAPGVYTFYVKVFANGCNTALSNSYTITVHPTPPADAVPESQIVCEGSPISLQSLTPPSGGLTYSWTGPSGFGSALQNPLVTNSAVKTNHEGKYILVTQRNGCFSLPDTVMVSVTNKPIKPTIGGNVQACAGQTLTLVCLNNPNAFRYIWTMPSPSGPQDTVTTVNSLQIPNLGNQNEGCYSVIVLANDCFSDASTPICVDVHDIPVITPSSNSPICQDSLLKLSASFASEAALTWTWTFPDGSQHFQQNINVPNGASGVYTLIGKTIYGCADTAIVLVNNVMPPVITFIDNTAPDCCDSSTAAVLIDSVVSQNGANYFWTGPGQFGSTLMNPVIPGVCIDDNGEYTLIVKDTFGCPSLPASTVINIKMPPAKPNLKVLPVSGTVCAGETVTLYFENPTTGASYTWNLPGGGDTTTTTPTFQLFNAQPGQSGIYSVWATSSDTVCTSGVSKEIQVTINAIPALPTITSNSPVCEGGILSFSTPLVPGGSYQWNGPAGFNPTIQNPSRNPVDTLMKGVYTLSVTLLGCTSPIATTQVDVIGIPDKPIIAPPPARLCMDVPVSEFLNILNPENGMIYTWIEVNSSQVLQSSTSTSLNLGMANVLALGPGVHAFQVTAKTAALPGCNSSPSNPVSIVFDTIPDGINAYAGMDHYACVDLPIELSATVPTGNVTGVWTQIPAPPTVTIDNAITPNASFEGMADSTYQFVWSLSNGACLNYDQDTIEIIAQFREEAYAGMDTIVCNLDGNQLHAIQGQHTQGIWTQYISQEIQGINIDNPTNPNTTISGNFQRGQTYVFFWQLENIGCGLSSDDVEVSFFNVKPNAGSNQFVCNNENCAQLQASSLGTFEFGVWSSNDLDLDFTINSPTSAEVCGLKPGKNIIYWTINGGACGDLSRDTMEVYYELFPTAVNDVVYVNFGDTAHFNVLTNDILPGSFSLTILSMPNPGIIIDSIDKGRFVYRPRSGFTGTDASMTYLICNTNCPSSCSIGSVTFLVGGAADCFIPTIITPNDDGFNDQFTIPEECTLGEGAAELDVTIYNQWGDAVFHAKPYQNDWGGTYNTEELPAGTYFYVVKLNDRDEPRSGFLLIQR